MAQSSAQRDPSMEEILASIRKIIEEGEEARQKPADLHDDFEATPIGPAANDATRRPLAAAPELRTVIPEVEPAADIVSVASPKPDRIEVKDLDEAVAAAEAAINELSLSLDDFVIDIAEVEEEIRSEEPSQAASANILPETVVETAPKAAAPEEVKPAAAVSVPEQEEASKPVAEVQAPSAAATQVFVAPQVEAPKAVVNSVVAGPAKTNRPLITAISGAVAPQVDQKSAMLSQVVERQVAASFTELSEALAASRRRPLDQIAEEMMRPMLQEWLDNNLPSLVERLVREEIERVARGTS
ncbi:MULTISPECIES: PopZ family protein [Mesorhizobium]|uniref:DUF2497 domain-containing protein n=1 Tax=Mesorhizobium denitrificans TaxID=2294114 RepID=A0A371XDR4_9HYPH|nr:MULTISPECIES: DUF2497 domain-containing protein [Mesorhizobium]RFC67368.1 DUF2497 domain-containing protein [Mesorhizobium denitrificans]